MADSGGPYLIGIGGPSGSGKSALAVRLVERLLPASAVIVPLDAYYRDLSSMRLEDRAKQNFDAPEALDWVFLEQQLDMLASGLAIERPEYDFSTHTRRSVTRSVQPTEYVLVEGLLALYAEAVRRMLDLRVYVEAPEEVCLKRRIERDLRERGRTRESVLQQYRKTVAPMAERYVYPTRAFADVVVGGAGPLDDEARLVLAAIHETHKESGSSRV